MVGIVNCFLDVEKQFSKVHCVTKRPQESFRASNRWAFRGKLYDFGEKLYPLYQCNGVLWSSVNPMFTMHVGCINFRWSPGNHVCVFVYNSCKNTSKVKFFFGGESLFNMIVFKNNYFVIVEIILKNMIFFMKLISINMSIPHFFHWTSYTS